MADEFNRNPQQSAEVQMAVSQAMNDQKKKKKKKKLIIILVIAALVIIGIVASSGGSDDKKENDNSTSASDSISADKNEKAEGAIGDYICTIKSATLCKDWEGKDSVKITYSFTNNASDAESFDIALSDEVYQDGIQLETTFLGGDNDDDWGIDVKIKPGMTKEVSKIYKLRDKSTPLNVEISEFVSFSDDKLTYTVNLD